MELVAFCLAKNPIARKKVSLKDLVECPLVLRAGGRLENVLMNLGHKVNVAMRCEAAASVKGAVRMGMGVGILYPQCCDERGDERKFQIRQRSRIKANGNTIVYYLR